MEGTKGDDDRSSGGREITRNINNRGEMADADH